MEDEVPLEPPKKRTLSPEALEKLQAARVKALEVRRANKLKYDQKVLEQLKESKEKDEAKAKEPEPVKRPKGRPKKEIVKTTEEEPSDTDFHHFPKKSKPKKLRKQTKIIIDNDSESDSDDDEPAIVIKTKKKKKKQIAPEPPTPKPEEPSIHDMSPAPITDIRPAEVIPLNPTPPPLKRMPLWMAWK